MNNVLLDITTTSTQFDYNLPEGNLSWRVRAENLNSVSLFSERSITIDLTEPSAPQLNVPADRSIVATLPIQLDWTADAGTTMDSLFIYTDSLISPAILSLETTNTNFDFSPANFGDYFWRLRSVDEAGNWSDYSPLWKFTYQ